MAGTGISAASPGRFSPPRAPGRESELWSGQRRTGPPQRVADPINIINSVLAADRAQTAAAAAPSPAVQPQARHTPAPYAPSRVSPEAATITPEERDMLNRMRLERGAPPVSVPPPAHSPVPPPPPRMGLPGFPSVRSAEQRRADALSRRRRGSLRAGLAEIDPAAPLWEMDDALASATPPAGGSTSGRIGQLSVQLSAPAATAPRDSEPEPAESGQQLLQVHKELLELLRRDRGAADGIRTTPQAPAAPPPRKVAAGAAPPPAPQAKTTPALAPPVHVPPPADEAARVSLGSPTEAREAALRMASQPVFLQQAPPARVAATTPPTQLPGWPTPQQPAQIQAPPHPQPQSPHFQAPPPQQVPPPQAVWQQGAAPQHAMTPHHMAAPQHAMTPQQQSQRISALQQMQPQQMQPQQMQQQQQERYRTMDQAMMFGSAQSQRRMPVSPWAASPQAVTGRQQRRPWCNQQYTGPRGEPVWHVLAQLFACRGIPVDPSAPRNCWQELLPALVDEALLSALTSMQQGGYLVRFGEGPRGASAAERFFFVASSPAEPGRRAEPWLLWCASHNHRRDLRPSNRVRLLSLCKVTAGPDDSDLLSNNLIVGQAGDEVLPGPLEKLGRPVELNPAGCLSLTFRDRDRPLELCAADPDVYKAAIRVFTAIVECNARAEALMVGGRAGPAASFAPTPARPPPAQAGWFGGTAAAAQPGWPSGAAPAAPNAYD
eukprot:TRINITY_DN5992_c0_g1_i2.p1 TRINITY_DN5992_c0_g1~~TRINITY_DN5992_c0_g1_i2.p1  ORF type:complete len:743 (+),score=279.93 TRINITY_DN5992_c0_g1_i2:73-2229(+)